jgi:hypothetical protein
MTEPRKPNSARSNHLRSLAAKRNWAAKKLQRREAEKEAKAQARRAADAEYKRRKDAGELTWVEERKELRNRQRQRSRSKWDHFCFELDTDLLLHRISVHMHKAVERPKPTLDQVVEIAERDFGFRVTKGRRERLKRILSSV